MECLLKPRCLRYSLRVKMQKPLQPRYALKKRTRYLTKLGGCETQRMEYANGSKTTKTKRRKNSHSRSQLAMFPSFAGPRNYSKRCGERSALRCARRYLNRET